MKIKEVKDEIIDMYKISLNFKSNNIQNHPIRILDSVKSIIGINPHEPLTEMLDNCKNYFSQFDKGGILFDAKNIKPLEVVTYLDLELSLLNQDKNKSFENVFHLSQVSDGKQICEFLMQFSLRYCDYSFLLIWSIYRMQLFVDFDNTLNSLLKCVECIIGDIKADREKINESIDEYFYSYKYSHDTFDLFYNLFRIINEDFTRTDDIQAYALSVMKEKCKFDKSVDSENSYFDIQGIKGRHWILDYLRKTDMSDMDIQKILNLDAARGALMITEGNNKSKKIWGDLNNIYGFKENR